MQACRLSIAQAHPSQVVKAVLDPPSHCLALLLADSSCLLLPSLFDQSASPFLIPSSCTDVAFLRLRSRSYASSSSSSSSSYSSRNSHGTSASLSEALLKPIGPRVKPVASHETKSGSSSTIGISGPGSGDGSLFFLAAMPGKGGSCTDLMAWMCKVPAFVSTPIRIDCREPCDSRLQTSESTVARLDVPHGLSVKISASVNVLVVYSPSVSKVWIMSAKFSATSGTRADCSVGDGIPLSSGSVGKKQASAGNAVREGASNVVPTFRNHNSVDWDRKEQSTNRRGCLVLVKCAVIDCNGPVFTVQVSLQHLLLGQLGGVRVWSLWPLIKGFKSQRRKALKAILTDVREGSLVRKGRVARERREGCDCGDDERSIPAKCGDSTAIERPAACARGICRRERRGKAAGLILAEPRNGFYETDAFIKGIRNSKCAVSGAYPDVGKDKVAGYATFIKEEDESGPYPDGSQNQGSHVADFLNEQHKTDSISKSLQGCLEDTFSESNGWKSKNQGASAPKTGNDISDLPQAVLKVAKDVDQEATPEDLTAPQGRNGLLSCDTCDLEDCNSQLILSQSSIPSSTSCSSHCCSSYPSSTLALVSNALGDSTGVHSSLSSSSAGCDVVNRSVCSTKERLCGLHNTNFMKGAREGDFLSFQGIKGQEIAPQVLSHLAALEQAVSIHGLSAGEFVILDSHGELHLLTLRAALPGEISREQTGFGVSENSSLQPVSCSMRIKLVVVLPIPPQSASSVAYPASRTLWISDGGHTIHIVSLSAGDISKEGVKTASHLNVIQTIFTTERISFLYALSVDTVMVLTEGSILAYSMIGT